MPPPFFVGGVSPPGEVLFNRLKSTQKIANRSGWIRYLFCLRYEAPDYRPNLCFGPTPVVSPHKALIVQKLSSHRHKAHRSKNNKL